MTVYLSIAFALMGLIAYFGASNSKVAEAGRLTYAVGLLVFLLSVGERMLRLGS